MVSDAQQIAVHFPQLRPAQHRGLALWVYGTILAQSACQNAVVTAWMAVGQCHALRQRLREWLYDGADKAAPCQTSVGIETGFAPVPPGCWRGGTAEPWRWRSIPRPTETAWWCWLSVCSIAAGRSRGRGTCCPPISRGPGCPICCACCGGCAPPSLPP